MARHETNFEATEEARLSAREALSLSEGGCGPGSDRADALARFLAAGDGWDEAARRLDGSFADCPALKKQKD